MSQEQLKRRPIPAGRREAKDYRLLLSGIDNYVHSSLFHEVYVKKDLPVKHQEIWEAEDDSGFRDFYTQFMNMCEEYNADEVAKWNHSQTLDKWIFQVLEILGWGKREPRDQSAFIENKQLKVIDRQGNEVTVRPSIVIAENKKGKDYIVDAMGSERLQTELSRYSTVVVLSGYYNSWADLKSGRYDHRRDEIGGRGDVFSNLGPDYQLAKYLELINCSWGFATDGALWRLFSREQGTETTVKFYEFNLGALFNHQSTSTVREYESNKEILKYFYWFFSKESHTKKPLPFIDQIAENSRTYAKILEEDIKGRFVNAMTIACNGYHRAFLTQSSKEADINLIRNTAESFIFSIIFARHCESNRVLPLHQDYIPLSLSNLVGKLKDYDLTVGWGTNFENIKQRLVRIFGKELAEDGTEIYQHVMALNKIIQEGTGKEKNFGFEIQGFEEQVFSEKEKAFYEKYKIKNKEMIRMLFELMYSPAEKGATQYLQVPYNNISPRQLGSMYESFLEYRAHIAPCQLYNVKKSQKNKVTWCWSKESGLHR